MAALCLVSRWNLPVYCHPSTLGNSQRPNEASENPALSQDRQGQDRPNHELDRQIGQALADLITKHTEAIVHGAAADLLGSQVASNLGWKDCTMLRFGRLEWRARRRALPFRSLPVIVTGRSRFVGAIAAHAAMALENARLFTRIEQANRHWVEIFDAISDFIVVHDESDKVLRVNRSLAAMIGVSLPN